MVKAAPYLGVVLVNEAAGLFRLFSPRIIDDDSAAVWDAEPFIIMGVDEADALLGFLDVTVKPVLDVAVTVKVILSRLVDTFSSRILYPMLLLSGNHSIAAVLSWEEGLH